MLVLNVLITSASVLLVAGRLLQSSLSFTSNSIYSFQPAHNIELLQSLFVPSLMQCSAMCVRLTDCRTFDYQASSKRCRLFQGSLDTGTIVNGSAKIGNLPFETQFFAGIHNASCAACVNNRYFICSNDGRCRCPAGTFWNGTICRNQLYEGAACNSDNWCRSDLGLRCSSARLCTSSSFLSCSATNTSTSLFTIIRNPTNCTVNSCSQSLSVNTTYFTLYCMSMVISIQKSANLRGITAFNHTFTSLFTNTTTWSDASHYFFGIQTIPNGLIFPVLSYSVVIKLNVTSPRAATNDTYEMIGLNGFNATYYLSNNFL